MNITVRLLCYSTLLEMCLTYNSDGLLGFHQFLTCFKLESALSLELCESAQISVILGGSGDCSQEGGTQFLYRLVFKFLYKSLI